MPLALPRAIKIELYCEVLNINNDLGVFSIPRQASGTKNTWVIIYTINIPWPLVISILYAYDILYNLSDIYECLYGV